MPGVTRSGGAFADWLGIEVKMPKPRPGLGDLAGLNGAPAWDWRPVWRCGHHAKTPPGRNCTGSVLNREPRCVSPVTHSPPDSADLLHPWQAVGVTTSAPAKKPATEGLDQRARGVMSGSAKTNDLWGRVKRTGKTGSIRDAALHDCPASIWAGLGNPCFPHHRDGARREP